MYKAVIFDRDGTLNRTTAIPRAGQSATDPTDGYVLTAEELTLIDGVSEALALLRAARITPFVFTQQNCIGKGLVSVADIESIHAHMNALLGPEAAIEAFYVAFNTPGMPDDPRAKPSPAMIHEVLTAHRLEAHEVLVAGDSLRDYHAARAAGTAFVWVRDDLARVSEREMAATGCPVFDSVLDMVKNHILPAAAMHKNACVPL